jgi:hypothetical protein
MPASRLPGNDFIHNVEFVGIGFDATIRRTRYGLFVR